jgi:4'-phosphopantetheinyl transferase EntD
MKEIKLRNKTATYKAVRLSSGKWLDFESGEVKSVDANLKFNKEAFELVEEKPKVEAVLEKVKKNKKSSKKESE